MVGDGAGPGGRAQLLGLDADPRDAVLDELDEERVEVGKAVEGIRAAGVFGEPEEWRFEWQQPYTRDEWHDQLPTHGLHTQLPQDKLQELSDGVGAVIDAAGGSFTMHYTVVVITAALTSKPA